MSELVDQINENILECIKDGEPVKSYYVTEIIAKIKTLEAEPDRLAEIISDLLDGKEELEDKIETLEAEKDVLYSVIYEELNWDEEDTKLLVKDKLKEAGK